MTDIVLVLQPTIIAAMGLIFVWYRVTRMEENAVREIMSDVKDRLYEENEIQGWTAGMKVAILLILLFALFILLILGLVILLK